MHYQSLVVHSYPIVSVHC